MYVQKKIDACPAGFDSEPVIELSQPLTASTARIRWKIPNLPSDTRAACADVGCVEQAQASVGRRSQELVRHLDGAPHHRKRLATTHHAFARA